MLAPFDRSYLSEAGACLVLAVPVQSAYCALRWIEDTKRRAQAHIPPDNAAVSSRFRLQTIFYCALICHILSIIFVVIGNIGQYRGMTSLADTMGQCCIGMTILSGWIFEFVEILLPFRYLSTWSGRAVLLMPITSIVLVCLGIGFIISLNLWQLIDIVFAAPAPTHIHIAVMMCVSWAKQQPRDPEQLSEQKRNLWRLRIWAALSILASIMSILLCSLAVFGQLPAGHGPSQCTINDILILFKFLVCYVGLENTKYRHPSIQRSDLGSSATDSKSISSTISMISNTGGTIPEVEGEPGSPRPKSSTKSNVSHPLIERSDSGVDLPFAPQRSLLNRSSSSSTTTAEVCNQIESGPMRFPEKPFSIFRVDEEMQHGYATMQNFMRQHIHHGRCIPEVIGQPRAVLDVGAGTDDWARDVQSACPDAQVLCTDIFPLPSVLSTSSVAYLHNANDPDWAWPERFDWIHFGGLDGAIQDWSKCFKSTFNCLRPRGFITVEQILFYLPPGNLAPSSVWPYWMKALDCIKAHRKVSFFLHDNQITQEQLRETGFDIYSSTRVFYLVKPGMHLCNGYSLSWAIEELMKGVFEQAWRIQPPIADKQDILQLLKEECNRGLDLKIITHIAQKPAGIP